jgi:hypothetical protein
MFPTGYRYYISNRFMRNDVLAADPEIEEVCTCFYRLLLT